MNASKTMPALVGAGLLAAGLLGSHAAEAKRLFDNFDKDGLT